MECRLCLEVSATLPLRDLAAELNYCCGLQTHANDGLPDHICMDCGRQLSQSSKFKRRCENSDKILRERLVKVKKPKYSESDEINQSDTNDSDHNCVQIEIKEEPLQFDQDPDSNNDDGKEESCDNINIPIKIEAISYHSNNELDESIVNEVPVEEEIIFSRLDAKMSAPTTSSTNIETKMLQNNSVSLAVPPSYLCAVGEFKPGNDRKRKISTPKQENNTNKQRIIENVAESSNSSVTKIQNIHFQTTQKNGVLLINDDGFCYLRHKSANGVGTEYWICDQRRTCPGRGISKNHRSEFRQTREHNHLPDILRREMRLIKNDIKQAAANGADASTLLQDVLMAASGEARARLPRLEHLKRNIQRVRTKSQAPMLLPQSRDAIIVPEEFQITSNTNEPEQFLLWDSGPANNGDERIMIFGTQRNLEFLRTCTTILVDETFNTPHIFSQLSTIHGFRLESCDQNPGKAVPLLFLLLPNNIEATYARVFNQLSSLLPGWQPDHIMVDIERGAINTAQAQWPNAQVSVCYYHLNKSLMKKMIELDLSSFYGEDLENTIRFKMISSLAFVPPEEIIDSWASLTEILQPWIQQQPQDVGQKLDDFLLYFEVNFIGQNIAGIRREPRIAAIEMWNVVSRTIDNYGRTDSEIEEFNIKVLHTTGAQFKNLTKFLKGLQGLQSETEKLIDEINSGMIGRKQRLDYLRLAERIKCVTATWPYRQNLEMYLREITLNLY